MKILHNVISKSLIDLCNSEIDDIKDAINKDANVGAFIEVLKGIASHQPTRRALIIGCSLHVISLSVGPFLDHPGENFAFLSVY